MGKLSDAYNNHRVGRTQSIRLWEGVFQVGPEGLLHLRSILLCPTLGSLKGHRCHGGAIQPVLSEWGLGPPSSLS